MYDTFKGRVGDHSFVKCPFLGNVLDNGKVKPVLAEIRVHLFDLVGFLLRADSCHHGMATLDEGI
jgi:hypothetical protein